MIPWFNLDQYLHIDALGPVQVHAFGILVATGILVGSTLTQRRGRELGLAPEVVASMITTVLLVAFFVSHIFDVFAYRTHGDSPTLLQWINPFGGLSSYGGFAGALMGLFFWCWRNKQPVMPYADSLAHGLATGWMFGRIGCFTAHDHPGRFSDFFLAVQYPEGARHDLGLYEAMWSGLIAGTFAVLHRRQGGGVRLGLYVTLLTLGYAPIRFGLDFLRATDVAGADPRYFGLTPAQYGSLMVLAAGVGLVLWLRHHPAPSPTTETRPELDASA